MKLGKVTKVNNNILFINNKNANIILVTIINFRNIKYLLSCDVTRVAAWYKGYLAPGIMKNRKKHPRSNYSNYKKTFILPKFKIFENFKYCNCVC